jgi:hypothetical protein
MSDQKNITLFPSMGAASLLGVAFVVLKLCHVINWSWWWVTCPFWGGAALALAVLIGVLLFGLGACLIGAIVAKSLAKRG